MKYFFVVLTLTVLFSSCDNELVVTDEWKDTSPLHSQVIGFFDLNLHERI